MNQKKKKETNRERDEYSFRTSISKEKDPKIITLFTVTISKIKSLKICY